MEKVRRWWRLRRFQADCYGDDFWGRLLAALAGAIVGTLLAKVFFEVIIPAILK